MQLHAKHLRPSRRLLIAFMTGVLVATPAAVLASHRFNDVPDDHIFHDDISAIADVGVTLGCGGGNYCPDLAVDRGQMAAFMNRLGSLDGTTPPSVNAKTAVTAQSATTAQNATNADNANTLDGLDSLAFQARVTGTCVSGSSVGTVHADGSVDCNSVGSGAVRVTTETEIAANTTTQATAYCPEGQISIGGGYLPKFVGNPIEVYGFINEQSVAGQWGYRAYATNPSSTTAWILIVTLLCVDSQ